MGVAGGIDVGVTVNAMTVAVFRYLAKAVAAKDGTAVGVFVLVDDALGSGDREMLAPELVGCPLNSSLFN